MQHNETGREPTEPTDAELLRKLMDIHQQCGAFDNEWGEKWNTALLAVYSRGEEYLSGQRPLPNTPAPDEVERLRAEVVEQSATIARQFELLKGVANVLKGQAGETELWSHADLPEMATRLTARVAELERMLLAVYYRKDDGLTDEDFAAVIALVTSAPRKGADQ